MVRRELARKRAREVAVEGWGEEKGVFSLL